MKSTPNTILCFTQTPRELIQQQQQDDDDEYYGEEDEEYYGEEDMFTSQDISSFSSFQSLLRDEYYADCREDECCGGNGVDTLPFPLFQSAGESSTCSPSSTLGFFPNGRCFSSLTGHPFHSTAFDFGESGILGGNVMQENGSPSSSQCVMAGVDGVSSMRQSPMDSSDLSYISHLQNSHMLRFQEDDNLGGVDLSIFRDFESSVESTMRPSVECYTAVGCDHPTLYQKRGVGYGEREGKDKHKRGKVVNSSLDDEEEEEEVEDGSIDGSCMVSELEEGRANVKEEENIGYGGGRSRITNTSVPGSEGKRKGMPAKNLMAERRRRKKLNDRLYMLRSVVPKISKMDRASILADAIDYLKELLQRIKELHHDMEPTSPLPSSSYPSSMTLRPPSLVKEEHCPFPNLVNQPTTVEVRIREGRAVNIRMFCARRPGLLLSTMKALENLGLDVQQAVISCFNGFALDVLRAEQCKEGGDVLPEQIKAVLLDTATSHGVM